MPQALLAAFRPVGRFTALAIALSMSLVEFTVGTLSAQWADAESEAPTSEVGSGSLSAIAKPFFASYCNRCHGARRAKAGLRLDTIGFDLADPARSESWSTIQTMVQFTEMPPSKTKKQPGLELENSFERV